MLINIIHPTALRLLDLNENEIYKIADGDNDSAFIEILNYMGTVIDRYHIESVALEGSALKSKQNSVYRSLKLKRQDLWKAVLGDDYDSGIDYNSPTVKISLFCDEALKILHGMDFLIQKEIYRERSQLIK